MSELTLTLPAWVWFFVVMPVAGFALGVLIARVQLAIRARL